MFDLWKRNDFFQKYWYRKLLFSRKEFRQSKSSKSVEVQGPIRGPPPLLKFSLKHKNSGQYSGGFPLFLCESYPWSQIRDGQLWGGEGLSPNVCKTKLFASSNNLDSGQEIRRQRRCFKKLRPNFRKKFA